MKEVPYMEMSRDTDQKGKKLLIWKCHVTMTKKAMDLLVWKFHVVIMKKQAYESNSF